MFVTYSFYIPDIRCINCIEPIKQALLECSSLKIEKIEIDDKEVTISIPQELSRFFLQEKITEVLTPIKHTPVFSDESYESQTQEQNNLHRWKGIVGILSGFSLLALSMFGGPVSMAFMIPIALASGALTVLLGEDSYKRAWLEWHHTKRLTMDSLFAMSTGIVLLVSTLSFFVPGLPMMLETGLLIFGFRHVGLAIEGALTQVMQLNTRHIDRLPSQILVEKHNDFELQPIQNVLPSAIIKVQPGDVIPLDGVCLNSIQMIIEEMITGSPIPREIKKGESLLSGMVVADGNEPLLMRVTRPFATSHLKCRDQRMSITKFENKADSEIFAKKILNYFIPTVLVLSVISAAVMACFFSWAVAIRCGIAVLVSACPCTLGLVVPLAVKIGMRKALDHGVQFRSKEQLQRAGEVNCVVFDLNGTLTMGIPVVKGAPSFDDHLISEHEGLLAITALERTSKHPHGQALYQAVKRRVDQEVDVEIERHHFGVSGVINQQRYRIGNERMMVEHEINIHDYQKRHNFNLLAGESLLYIAKNQQIVGHVILFDPIRIEARYAIEALQALGIETFLCTGADMATAKHFADELNIPLNNIRASQRCALNDNELDDDKSRFIKELSKPGVRVSMVGDAGNDAFAIAASYFGLALQSRGQDAISEAQAGAIINGSSLLPVVTAFAVAKQTVDNIKQNLYFSLGYNIVTEFMLGGLLTAMGFMVNPSVGVALMIAQMCLILGNAYWFKHQSLPHIEQYRVGDETDVNIPPSVSQRSMNYPMPSPQHGVMSVPKASIEETSTVTNGLLLLPHSWRF